MGSQNISFEDRFILTIATNSSLANFEIGMIVRKKTGSGHSVN